MNKYIDSLKEFYDNKVKIKKSKSKTIPEIEIEKIPYYYNKDYLSFLENKILEEKGKILIAKYNVYYDLETEIDAYEEIEKNIRMLKEERDRIKFNIERKEETTMKHINKLNDEIEGLKLNYSQLPEMVDKKIIYAEIGIKREEINSILNNNRCIILKEVNKKKIYTVTTDYEPIDGNEIIARGLEHIESSEPGLRLGETLESLKPDALENDFGSEGFAESKADRDLRASAKDVRAGAKDVRASAKNVNVSPEEKESKKKFTKLTFVSQNQANAEPKSGPEIKLRPKLKFNSNP